MIIVLEYVRIVKNLTIMLLKVKIDLHKIEIDSTFLSIYDHFDHFENSGH